MLTAWIITKPIRATIIPVIAAVIALLAVPTFFSSPAAVRYKMPAMTKAIMPMKPRMARSQFIAVWIMPMIEPFGSSDAGAFGRPFDFHCALAMVGVESKGTANAV